MQFSENASVWRSGLWNHEIHSAEIGAIFDSGRTLEKKILVKNDAIKFVRLAETCPMTEYDECPTSHLPHPGTDMLYVEFKLANDLPFWLALMGDRLQTSDLLLVDISSKRDEFVKILLQAK